MNEKAKNSSEFEPTLLDVLQAVQGGFQKMEERFEKNDVAHVSLFEMQRQTIELLNERTGEIKKDVSKVQNRVEDIVDVLEKASKKVSGLDVTQLLNEETYHTS